MKQISKLLLVAIGAVLLFAACDKKAELPFYNNGSQVVLSRSVATVAAAPADSLKTVLSFTWTSPNYASTEATNKYIVQIDTAGGNFAKGYSKEVTGLTSINLSTAFTAKELNNILLGYGFLFGKEYNMIARVVSSYANNNQQFVSNTVAIKMTPYKVPPKIPVPATGKLFIVGDATQGEWGNPVPVPTQEFSKIDETTWGGVFRLNGGASYLLLVQNGQWNRKYAVEYKPSNNSGLDLKAGGDFGYHEDGNANFSGFNDNFFGPDVDGWYKITVDFQTGKFTVKATDPVPDNLYAIGDATPANPQWDNSNVGGQKLTKLNSSDFEITIPLEAGKNVKFIGVLGSWNDQFGKGANDGDLGVKYNGQGNDPGTIVPSATGNYKVWLSFTTRKYTLTKL